MGAMASQITSLTIVYLAVYSGADQSLGILHTKASDAGKVSIWWRHNAYDEAELLSSLFCINWPFNKDTTFYDIYYGIYG